MKTLRNVAALAVMVAGIFSCTEDGTIPVYNNVGVYSQVHNPSSQPYSQQTRVQSSTAPGIVSTIHVTDVEVLISRLQLHVDQQPEGFYDHLVSAGPLVLRANDSTTKLTATAQVSTNLYREVKFELHRFTPEELSAYIGDSTFVEFTTPMRYTMVIRGTVDDTASFTYATDIVANLSLPFETALLVNDRGVGTINIAFDVTNAFRSGLFYLDPRFLANKPVIDSQLRVAFTASHL